MEIRLMTLADKEFVMSIDKHVDDEKYDQRVYSKSGYILCEEGEMVGTMFHTVLWDNLPFMNYIFILEPILFTQPQNQPTNPGTLRVCGLVLFHLKSEKSMEKESRLWYDPPLSSRHLKYPKIILRHLAQSGKVLLQSRG